MISGRRPSSWKPQKNSKFACHQSFIFYRFKLDSAEHQRHVDELASQIETLEQENTYLHSKMSALEQENRDLRVKARNEEESGVILWQNNFELQERIDTLEAQ